MFTLLQVLAVIIFSLILLVTAWWYLSMPSNLPPGPLGLPIFGSMFDTWNINNLTTKLLHWTKIYGPVYKLYIADRLVLILANFEAIHEALVKQGDAYAGKPYDHDMISTDVQQAAGFKVSPDAEVWKHERRFVLSTLRDLGVGGSILETKINQEVDYLLDQIEAFHGRPFDPHDFLLKRTANVMCGLVFGKRFHDDEPDFVKATEMLSSIVEESNQSILSPFILSERLVPLQAKLPQVKKYENDMITIIRFLQKEIGKQKLEFESDTFFDDKPANFIEAFYNAQKREGPEGSIFTKDHLVVSVFNLFVAGIASTAITLRFALMYLARYPEVQEKMYQEIRTRVGTSATRSYADRIKLPICEALITEIQRMFDGLPFGSPRKTVSPTKLFGYDIPKDTVVIPLMTALMKDSKVFPNPNEFDYKRFLKSETNQDEYKNRLAHVLPFQIGKRACPGESLARMELLLFLIGLISRYQFSYSPDDPIPSESEEGIAVTFGKVPVPFKLCAKARND